MLSNKTSGLLVCTIFYRGSRTTILGGGNNLRKKKDFLTKTLTSLEMKTKIIYISFNTKFDTSNFRDCYSRRMFAVPSVVYLGSTVNVSSANEKSGFAVKDALSQVRDCLITENLLLHSQDVPYNVVAFFSNIEKFGWLLVNDLGRESLNSSNFCFHDANSISSKY